MGGGTPLQEANGDVLLNGVHFHDQIDYNGVAFSIQLPVLNGVANIRILGVSRDSKWEECRLQKSESCCFIKFNNKLTLTALHSVLETTLIR